MDQREVNVMHAIKLQDMGELYAWLRLSAALDEKPYELAHLSDARRLECQAANEAWQSELLRVRDAHDAYMARILGRPWPIEHDKEAEQ